MEEKYTKLCNGILERHFEEILKEMQYGVQELGIEKDGYVVDGYLDIFHAIDVFREEWESKIV